VTPVRAISSIILFRLFLPFVSSQRVTVGFSRVLVSDDDNDIPSLHHHSPESPSPLVASTPDVRLALCQQRTASLSAVHSLSVSSAQPLCQQRTAVSVSSAQHLCQQCTASLSAAHSVTHCAAHSVIAACCFCLLFVSQHALLVCLFSMPP
jgi:hypothetical protein